MRARLGSLTAAAAVLLVGCGASAPRLATMPAPPTAPMLLVAQAGAAFADRDAAAAVSFAELAVRADPSDVASRRALARYYLASGRFRAAADAYEDLVAMQPGDADARLKLGVALLAGGRTLAGIAAIEASGASATDKGLALALAGEAERAAAMLDAAARAPGADARLRQNLALAHALAGRWVQARAVAAQDLPPAEVDARVRAWAALSASDAATRTRAFLAVAPAASDPGRPVELAYRAPGSEPAMATTQDEAPAAPVLARIDPPAAIRTVALHREERPAPTLSAQGGWVVQLGAYPSGASRHQTWRRLRQENSVLRGMQPILTSATLPSGTFHRLAVGGFEQRRPAVELCISLRVAGQSCFVRRMRGPADDAPVRLASR